MPRIHKPTDDDNEPSSSKKKQTTLKFGGASKKFTKVAEHPSSSQQACTFLEFCELCGELSDEPSYTSKTNIIKQFIKRKSSNGKYNGNLYLLVKLLLPGVQKRVYNLKDKQIVKLFSEVFNTDLEDMITDLEKGNVSETVKEFFSTNYAIIPCKKSTLNLKEVDNLLDELAGVTKEDAHLIILKKIAKRCTAEDLKYMVRLIKHDLRMNTGTKHVLEALDANAYAAYQSCSDLQNVVDKIVLNKDPTVPGLSRNLSIKASLMTPVKPMLADACKSCGDAMKKCVNGMYAEIKYDGERVQVHKQGNQFEYFSRSLKAVQAHKVAEIKDFLPKACPQGDSLIVDGEVLLVDNKTGKPLPFGTLGIHKKSKFQDASVCLVIFDILQFNDENLMTRPLVERRRILEKNVKEIKNHIILSQMTHITKEAELKQMLDDVFAKNLEGLVLKDLKSTYKPGKRHWLKMKKDYLHEGAMADSADLVVLGAYYGTGNKGGLMSVFLMGCFNPSTNKWVTVAKCGNGHDDKMINKLQKQLKMIKISKDTNKIPAWLDMKNSLVPDFVIKDPKRSPVWEISGAEFSKSTTHTANGISIRFPRVTRIRDDKDWSTATDLPTLQRLFDTSKLTSDDGPGPSKAIDDHVNNSDNDNDNDGKKMPSEEDAGRIPAKEPKEETKRKRKLDSDDDDDDRKKKPSEEVAGRRSTKEPKEETKRKRKLDSDDDDDDRKKKPSEEVAGRRSTKKPKGETKRKHKPDSDDNDDNDDDDDDNDQPSPKKKAKLACKYGGKCYQKSKEHLNKYYHSTSSTVESAHSLPNVFTGQKIHISSSVENADKLRRYIVAYDGDLVDELHLATATHVVSSAQTNKSTSTNMKIVTAKWIWDSIKKNTMLSESNYSL